MKAKIAGVAVGLFVVAVWGLAQHLVREVHADFEDVVAAQQLALVEHIANSLDEEARLRIATLEDIAQHIPPAALGEGEGWRLRAILATRHVPRLFNLGMVVVAADGTGLADYPVVEGRGGAGFAASDFPGQVIAAGATTIGRASLGRFTNQPVVAMGTPIRDGDGRIRGALIGINRVSDTDFFTEIVPKRSRLGGEFHIASPRDRLHVASTNAERVLQPLPPPGVDPLLDRFIEGYQGSGVSVDPQGVERLISSMTIPSTGWLVIATMPTDVAFAPIRSMEGEIYKDAAICMAILAIVLWLYLHRQLVPLNRAAAILDEMAGGWRPLQPLPLEGSREIRGLLGSFNRFQARITEQKRLLMENAEQMRLLASVFDGTSEAILITDAQNRILRVNQPFCRLTGYQESELIGQNPNLLRSGRQDVAFYRGMWEALETTGHWAGELWNRRRNGEVFPVRQTISTVLGADGKVQRHVAISADISAEKQAREIIWRQANYDLLTDLPNRRLSKERLGQDLAEAERARLNALVCLINLDRFKEINNVLGHAVGDWVLVETAERLKIWAGGVATVGHLGGDEFVVAVARPDDGRPLDAVPEELRREIGRPFDLGVETVHITASIGVAVHPGDGADVATLLRNADQAMHEAKTAGRNRTIRFTESMFEASQARSQLAGDLREALGAGQFDVYYQPIVDMATRRIIKAEALLRWRHPQRGFVSPAQFIPIAEETGVIVEIGDWVFRQAAAMAKFWCGCCSRGGKDACRDLDQRRCRRQISVNKSPRQFLTGSSQREWLEHLRAEDIDPRLLAIEITEGLLLDSHDEVAKKLAIFRQAGIQVALDDFGTGYSAMSYLKRFAIDYLKIDQTFVRDIEEDPNDRAIVEAIIAMAHRLGMRVIAEGIETAGQRDLLAAVGCDFGQGYLFAKPMPAGDFAALVERDRGDEDRVAEDQGMELTMAAGQGTRE